MADTQQGVRHQSARDAAGTVDTYDGDLRALFNAVATVPAGSTFNEAFMLWLQSVTGSSADNINDLAALYASQQEDTYNWSSVGALGLPTLFDWEPETAEALPATSTFARASVAQVLTTTDGTTNWYQGAKSGEVRLDGLRRVENNIPKDITTWSGNSAAGSGVAPVITNDFGTDPDGTPLVATRVQLEAGGGSSGDQSIIRHDFSGSDGLWTSSIWVRLNTGTSESLQIGNSVGFTTITVTDAWQRFQATTGNTLERLYFQARGSITGAAQVDLLVANGTEYGPQSELVQNASDAVGEYANPDVEYLNIGVNGVRYFNTTNGNSVDGSGVVTEATGTTITGGGYLPEPAATNNVTDSDDFNAASWTITNLTSVTDNGINDLGLRQHTLLAAAGGGVHRIFDSGVLAETAYFIVKAGTERYCIVRNGDDGATDYSAFDLQLGTVTEDGSGSTGRITGLGNGWYKCEVTTTSASSFVILHISDTGTPGSADYTWNPAGTETILVCQGQGENTAFSTSPIITSGSTVTRVADSLKATGLITELAYSCLSEMTWPSVLDETSAVLALGNLDQRLRDASPSFGRLQLNTAGVSVFVGGVTPDVRIKIAFSVEENNNIMSATGVSSAFDTTSSVPPTGDFVIGASQTGSSFDQQFRGRIHNVKLYSVPQTQAQLEALVA